MYSIRVQIEKVKSSFLVSLDGLEDKSSYREEPG